jgi:outer membrane receptor protein involved in Fe transport
VNDTIVVGFDPVTGDPIRRNERGVPQGFNFINYSAPVNSPFDLGIVPGSLGPNVGLGIRNDGVGGPSPLAAYYQLATNGDGGPTDVLNFNLANIPTSTLDTARTSVIASFNHQIFGKTLEIFGNFLYSNSDYQSFLNAQPVTTAGGVIIPPGNADPANGPIVWNPFNFGIGGDFNQGPNGPPGTNVNNVTVRNRYQVAPRIFDNNNNFYRFLGGLRSQINEDWMVEAAGYYSKYDINYVNSNLVIADGLNNLIANEGLDFFRLDPIGNGPGQVSGDLFATAFGTNIRSLSSFQRVFDAKVVGFPFSLPAGKVGFTLGGEIRLEGFKVKDSPEVFLASVPIAEINKKRQIESVFSEISIPIVSSTMNIPAIYSLELNLAGRFDHYDGIDEDAKVPKVTLRYQPIKDLTLRATYSNSFIAPNLYQQFGPSSTGFSQALTFSGVPQDQAQVLALSNPNLNPSTAESYTAGLVYSPSFVAGLVISVDYFRTLQQGIVGGLGGNTILQSANNLGINSPFAGLVAFGDFPGTPGAIPFTADRQTLADAGILTFSNGVYTNPNNGAVIGPDQAGVLFGNLGFPTTYVDTQSNLGAQRSEGFDLSLRWNIDMHQAGELEIGANAVVFTLYDFKTSVLTDYYNLLGLNGTEFFGVNPDYKLNMYAEYRIWGFTLGFNANYIPETLSAVGRDPELEDQDTFENVDDFFSVDGRLSYTFVRTATEAPASYSKDGKGTIDKNPVAGAATLSPMDKLLNGLTLTVGCNNMFDEQPPFIDGGNSNTNLAVYDPFGQFFYFEISKKF